jgi:peptidoglycan/LPS O-acetylase OafA/YrhL
MTNQLKKTNKIISIQYLRGLAAVGVVLFHFSASLALWPILKVIFNFGQTGVHVFFLISGFIITFSLLKEGYQLNQFFTFLIKRSIRIDPPYYLTVLLSFLLLLYLSIISPIKESHFRFIPQQFLAHLFYFIPFTKYPFYSVVFWTLCIEFQFYLLIGLFYFLSQNWYYKNLFLIMFGLTSFFHFSNCQYVVFTYAPIFATGMSLVTFYLNRAWYNSILPLTFLILTGFKFGIPVFILLGLTSLVILYFELRIKSLIFIGNISYSLYLVHTLISEVLLRIEIKHQLHVGNYPLFWLIFEFSISIFISYLFYEIVERPAMALSKQFHYKKSD